MTWNETLIPGLDCRVLGAAHDPAAGTAMTIPTTNDQVMLNANVMHIYGVCLASHLATLRYPHDHFWSEHVSAVFNG